MNVKFVEKEINEKKGNIKIENSMFSVGEILNLYKDGDLDIHPDFQRFFRWQDEQKSRFIESLFLGLPIPSLFVYERKDGVWEVLDGLQRISSLLQYVGILKNEKDKILPALHLNNLEYINSLNNSYWKDLSQEQQRLFKKNTLPFIIMKSETTEIKKYQLFQRLNKGGSSLTIQEVRNCAILMNNSNFYELMERMAKNEDFIISSNLTDKQKKERKDLALITRYLCLKYSYLEDLKKVNSVDDFLDKKIITIANDNTINYDAEYNTFSEIFEQINNQLGICAFKRYDEECNNFKGSFLMAQYETLLYSLTHTNNYTKLKNKLISLTQNNEYKEKSVGGISVKNRWNTLLQIGQSFFGE